MWCLCGMKLWWLLSIMSTFIYLIIIFKCLKDYLNESWDAFGFPRRPNRHFLINCLRRPHIFHFKHSNHNFKLNLRYKLLLSVKNKFSIKSLLWILFYSGWVSFMSNFLILNKYFSVKWHSLDTIPILVSWYKIRELS